MERGRKMGVSQNQMKQNLSFEIGRWQKMFPVNKVLEKKKSK